MEVERSEPEGADSVARVVKAVHITYLGLHRIDVLTVRCSATPVAPGRCDSHRELTDSMLI